MEHTPGKLAAEAEALGQELIQKAQHSIKGTSYLDYIKPGHLIFFKSWDLFDAWRETLEPELFRKLSVHAILPTGHAPELQPQLFETVTYSPDPEVTWIVFHNIWHGMTPPVKIEKAGHADIHPSAQIGTPGQKRVQRGFRIYDMTQVGGVMIGYNVKVGPYSVIHRGSLGWTRIGDSVWIGALSNIGHSAWIGPATIVTCNVSIGGHANISPRSFIGMGAVINNHVRISEPCMIGSGAVVTKDIEKGGVYAGVPAKFIRSWNGDWASQPA